MALASDVQKSEDAKSLARLEALLKEPGHSANEVKQWTASAQKLRGALNVADETKGLLTPGNIDLYGQPEIKNPDGTVSTVRSMSFNENGKEILVPTAVGGKIVSSQEAIDAYHRTGKHLGVFDTPESATVYAQQLHNDYATGKYSFRGRIQQMLASGMTEQDIIARMRARLAQIMQEREQFQTLQPHAHFPPPDTRRSAAIVEKPVAPGAAATALAGAPPVNPEATIKPNYPTPAERVGGPFGHAIYPTPTMAKKVPILGVSGNDALSLIYGVLGAAGINIPAMKGLQPGSGPWDFTAEGQQISAMSPEQQVQQQAVMPAQIGAITQGLGGPAPNVAPEQMMRGQQAIDQQSAKGAPIDPVSIALLATSGGLANLFRKKGIETAGALLADPVVSELIERSPLARKLFLPLIGKTLPHVAAVTGGVTPFALHAGVKRTVETGDILEGIHAAADTYESVLQIEAMIQGAGMAVKLPGPVLKTLALKLETATGEFYAKRLNQTRVPTALEYQSMMKQVGYVAGDIVKEADANALSEFKKRLRWNLDILSDHLSPGVKSTLEAVDDRLKEESGVRTAGEVVSKATKRAARTVSAEGTMQPGGKPFSYLPGASAAETAAIQNAATAAEEQIIARRSELPGARAVAEINAAEVKEGRSNAAIERAFDKSQAAIAEKFAAPKPATPEMLATIEAALQNEKNTPKEVGRFSLVPVAGGKVQLIDKVSGVRVSKPMDAVTAAEVAEAIDSGKVKITGLAEKPVAPTPETPLTNRPLTREDRLARMKAQNEARIRVAALKKAQEAVPPPEAAPPEPMRGAEEAAQQAFEDAMPTRPPSRRENVDLHRGIESTPMKPRSGPVADINAARNMLDAAGFRITPVQMDVTSPTRETRFGTTGGVKSRTTGFEVVSKDGAVKFQTTTIDSALKRVSDFVKSQGPRAYSLFAGELANQSLFADSPDDDDDTLKQKMLWRNAIRLGVMAPLVGALVSTPGESLYRNLRGVGRTFLRGLPEQLPESPKWRAAMEASFALRKNLFNVQAFRGTIEVVRNMAPAIRDVVSKSASVGRAYKRDLFAYMQTVNTEFARMGVSAKTVGGNLVAEFTGFGKSAIDASRNISDTLEGIHNNILSKMPEGASKGSYHKAIDLSLRRHPDDFTPEQAARAHAAIDALGARGLLVTNKVAGIYKELRSRATLSYFEKFVRREGTEKPYAAFEQDGTFVGRYETADKAAKAIDGMAGATTKLQVEPTQKEMDKALGTTVLGYVPHLVYDSLANKVHINDVIRSTPWNDPQIFINEVDRIMGLTSKQRHAEVERIWGKEIGYDANGALNQTRYKKLVNDLRDTMGRVNAGGKHFALSGIPKDIFVRFFKERLKTTDYAHDVIAGLRAYIPAALRFIHFEPLLPDIEGGMSHVRSQVEAGNLTPASLWNIEDFFDTMLQRKRAFSPELGHAVGVVSNWAYGAALWGSGKPAIDNFFGQVFLVGVPELGGRKSLAAVMALADPHVREVLAKHDLIRNSMPIGEISPVQLWHNLNTALKTGNPHAVVGTLKDSFQTMGNFIGTFSEPPIRMWAMVGGLLDYMEKNKAVLDQVPGLGFVPGNHAKGLELLRAASKHYDKLPEEFWDRAVLHSEDMVGKVAYFFEEETLPPFLRMVKRVPGGGFFTMFTNFPVNYGNRLVSDALDMFNMKIPAETRRHAAGSLLRRLGMTYLMAGPLGLPFIQTFTDEVSALDEGKGAALRRFLMPFHNAWLRTLGSIYGGQDMSRFGFLEPITEAFSGRRFSQAPVIQLLDDSMSLGKGVLGELMPEELRTVKQRFFGALTDTFTNEPDPESNMMPEALTRFMYGGRAINALINYAIEKRNVEQGLPSILDPQHRGQVSYDPGMRLLFGQSYAERIERNEARALAKYDQRVTLKKADLVNAIVNPRTSGKERTRAWREFLSNVPALKPPDIEAITKAQQNLYNTPAVRAMQGLSGDALNTLALSGSMEKMVADINSLPERDRALRMNLYLAYLAARAKAAQ